MPQFEQLHILGTHAKAGDVKAQIQLGRYHAGLCMRDGVAPDRRVARRWFEKAVKSREPKAITCLAELLLTCPSIRCDQREHDIEQGKTLLLQAVALNYPQALFRIGVELDRGIHFPRDRAESVRMVRRAGELGAIMGKLASIALDANPDWKISPFDLIVNIGKTGGLVDRSAGFSAPIQPAL